MASFYDVPHFGVVNLFGPLIILLFKTAYFWRIEFIVNSFAMNGGRRVGRRREREYSRLTVFSYLYAGLLLDQVDERRLLRLQVVVGGGGPVEAVVLACR